MRFLKAVWNQIVIPRWIPFWRGFSAVFALYFAATAYRAGLHGRHVEFDVKSLLAALYVYSCAKSHSAVKLLRKRRYND